MSLKAVIVEDEKHSRETLKNLIQEFCADIEVIGLASSVEDAIDTIKSKLPDVIFLDIELQTGTGFDVLNEVSHLDFEVIFTTAFEQYAIKSVKFSSLDYLLKPIDLEELQHAVDKAHVKKNQFVYKKQLETLMLNIKQQNTKFNKICLATSEGYEFIEVTNVIYCKAEGSYTKFVLKNDENLLVSKHLKTYEDLFLEHDFMRVHNSFLINLKEVKKYIKADGGYIVMNNNDPVNISRSKKEDFIHIIQLLVQ